MRRQKAFTLIELLVVISIIAILMAVLMPALKRAREGGKRSACLSNLKQLALAWNMYADENDDRLVNGATGFSFQNLSWGDHSKEKSWIDGFHPNASDYDLQKEDIRRGALFPYLRNDDLYQCPTGRRGQALTYSIMFSMNAVNHPWSQGIKGAHVKKRTEIRPNLAQRFIMIDEGFMTSDAYAAYIHLEQWFDNPPVRHGDGVTVNYADGRAEHIRWRGTDTIKHARDYENMGPQVGWVPNSDQGFEDLYTVQRGCWGKLNYTPNH